MLDGWVANESVEVSFSNPVRSRRNPDATLDATVVNTSDKPLVGPVRFVIAVFTPDSVSLGNSEGKLAGHDYFTLIPEGSELAVGATIKTAIMTIIGGGSDVFSIDGGVYTVPVVEPNELAVDIALPETLLTVGASPIEVSGTINDANAQLTLNGVPVNHQNGKFNAGVELTEGFNTIAARATSNDGQQTTDSIVVSLDLTPPYLTIESHKKEQVVYAERITVTGLVNDIVRGTVEAEQAKVQVNGVNAEVSNRSYAAHNILLTEGINTIQITGADNVGNSTSISQTVIYKVISGSKLNLVSGQDQSGEIGSTLTNDLTVQLVDADNNPIADETVVFRVVQGAGAVGAETDGSSRAIIKETDHEGKASTKFQLGFRTGIANHKVKAKVVGYENDIVFTASATSVVGDKISVNSGNNQRGVVGQTLPAPFIVAVSDSGANTVKGARVRFDVIKGQGVFQNEQSSFEVMTDTDGRASAQLTLGPLSGIDAQRVEAVLLDAPEGVELLAGFSATAFLAAEPGNTSVSGVVLDNQDTPIPGVTVRIENTDRTAKTNQQGRFAIAQAPVGPIHIIVDGSTATVVGEFPSLSYHLVTVSGVDNPMSAPVYMVKLDTENGVIAGKEDVVLTLDNFPGFKLEIAKDSVTFPDGSREGIVSVTSVNASKVPMAPPNGMQPQFIVTIQPVGAVFSPAAKLTLPNIDGHAPGAQVEMYSFDHDLEEFVAIGLGTVSEDGSIVSSNPGVGVIKAGWHCGSQPGGSGTAHNCPECQKCKGSSCIRDPAQDNNSRKQQTPEDCKTNLCKGTRAEPGDIPFSLDKPNNCKKAGCDGKNPTLLPDDKDKPVIDTQPGNCHAPSCLNGSETQSSLIDDDDVPAEDGVPGNCFKTNCNRGIITENIEPDATDITEEDAKCKFCDGNLGIKDKPDDTPVPDEKCKICKNGEVTDISDSWKNDASVGAAVSAPSVIVNTINSGLQKIPNINVQIEEVVAGIKGKIADCCDKDTGDITIDGAKELEVSGSFVITLKDLKVWPAPGAPNITFDQTVSIPLTSVIMEVSVAMDAGVFFNSNVEIGAKWGNRSSVCVSEDNCDFGSLFGNVNAQVKASAYATACADATFFDGEKCSGLLEFTPVALGAQIEAWGGYNVLKCGDGWDGGVDVKGLVFSVSLSFPGLPSFTFGYDIIKGTYL
jgi:hypothetical protein